VNKTYIIKTFVFLVFIECHSSKKTQKNEIDKDYIFFVHNKFLEENWDGTLAKEYNVKVEYNEMMLLQ